MFGPGERGRVRSLVVAGLVTAGVGGVAAVGASAIDHQLAPLPKAQSSVAAGVAALKSSIAAGSGPKASAVVANVATTVSCGQTITKSTTLTANLNCDSSSGLTIGANSVVLNLNGHFIVGSGGMGVEAAGTSDTIENGYVIGFADGVDVFGDGDKVTNMQVSGSADVALFLQGGSKNQVPGTTVAENGLYGIVDDASNDTLKGDEALNNGNFGIVVDGPTQVVGNAVDGNGNADNGSAGILADSSTPSKLTGNTANHNAGLGIDAVSPQIDGGGNKADANGTAVQCAGVAC
jgi:hypothetical protein